MPFMKELRETPTICDGCRSGPYQDIWGAGGGGPAENWSLAEASGLQRRLAGHAVGCHCNRILWNGIHSIEWYPSVCCRPDVLLQRTGIFRACSSMVLGVRAAFSTRPSSPHKDCQHDTVQHTTEPCESPWVGTYGSTMCRLCGDKLGGGDASTSKDEECNANAGIAVYYGMSTALRRQLQHIATDIHFIDINLEGVSEGPWTDLPVFLLLLRGPESALSRLLTELEDTNSSTAPSRTMRLQGCWQPGKELQDTNGSTIIHEQCRPRRRSGYTHTSNLVYTA